MTRYFISIVSGLVASLAIFWLAAFLVREPADIRSQKPRPIVMPTFTEVEEAAFAWDDSIPQPRLIICGCCWDEFGTPTLETKTQWPKTKAQVTKLLSRPATPPRHEVTAAQLKDNHTQPAVLDAPYPRMAQGRGLEGDVLIEATLAADGSVASATVVGAAPKGLFDKVALEAVMEARFDAPIRDGQQVRPLTRRFLIKFRLPAAA